MQPYQRPPEGGKVPFLYGLIFGVGMFVVGVIFYCINTFLLSSTPPLTYLVTGLAWLLDLGFYFLVGTLVARKTGKVGTATIAGVWTAVFDGVLYAIFTTIMLFTVTLNRISLPQSSSSSVSPETTRSLTAVGGILVVVMLLLLTIGIGAGMAALGGLLGRSLARSSGNPYLAGPFPYGQPLYPGQPPFPGQPYPGQPLYGQPYPGPSYPGQPPYGQPQPGQPYPGQPPHGYFHPGQPSHPSQTPYGQPQQPGQPYPGQPPYRQPVPERPAEPREAQQPPSEAEHKPVYASGPQAEQAPPENGSPEADTDKSSSDETLRYRPN